MTQVSRALMTVSAVAAGCVAMLGISLVGASTDAGPADRPASLALSATDCVSEPEGAAGQLKFSTTAVSISESGAERLILVLRTGGGAGPVSATVRTSAESAAAGSDYTAVDTTIEFPDGDTTVRLIRIPIVGDSVHEDVETLAVSLSDPVCATLGANTTVVLTIHDDDVVSTFAVGGTVSGLEGTGLLLRTNTFQEVTPGNGEFVFPRGLTAGSDYGISVHTQPGNPGQICTVINGVGVMPESAVTDVAVTCEPPARNPHLDPSFGAGGITTTPGIRGAQAVAVQPDGMIVTAGDDSLTRYHPDGTPDTGFGTNGSVATGLDSAFDGSAIDVALQSDGAIVVVGVIDNRTSTREDFAVQRYDSNGLLDSSFGTAGTVMTDFNGGSDRAYAVAVQADGAILVAGNAATVGAPSDFAVARYTAAGVLDETYDGDGRVTTDFGGANDFGHDLVLQPDGKAVVSGRIIDDAAGEDFGVARYLDDGTLDLDFNGSGISVIDFPGEGFLGGSIARGVTVDNQSRIIIAGDTSTGFVGGNSNIAVARLDGNGALDTSFDGDGLVTTDFADLPDASSPSDFGSDVLIQPDGRILVVGSTQFNGGSDIAVTRYEADGRLDTSFADLGRLTVDAHAGFDSGNDVALQPDGRVVVVGSGGNGTTVENALARLLP